MREVEHHKPSIHEAEPQAAAVVPLDRVRVLLVDDQPFIGEAIRRMLLNQPGLDFHYCPNASLAVETAERIRPTVILQDLVMPQVDGLTLVSRYRASAIVGNTPVIVLSSKEDPVIKRDAFQGGANDYLVKLPDTIELVARIRLHSTAYLSQIQRDEAYRKLNDSQRQLVERVQELQTVRDELSRMVSTDALTGLYSRRGWFDLAATEFSRSRRYKRPLAVLMADLDSFKRINDTYGHDAGDEIIRQFAHVLRVVCRESDFAGRVGGEEFAVLLPETSITGSEEVARRLVTACRTLDVSTPSGPVKFSCSVGVTAATEVDVTIEDVLRRADAAMYAAKRGGRDGWRVGDLAAHTQNQ